MTERLRLQILNSGEVLPRCQVEHIIGICKDNAAWHRHKYKATGDRYWLGQWKVWSRAAKRLAETEYDSIKEWS